MPADTSFFSPFAPAATPDTHLLRYGLNQLHEYPVQTRPLTITKVISSTADSTALEFTFQPLGKKMSGQLTVPTSLLSSTSNQTLPTIVMLRGYVPLEIFSTGVGTKNAAAVFASKGYLTVAPDFFGYGDSDPEPTDSWQARFEKPLIVMELLKTLAGTPIELPATVTTTQAPITVTAGNIGMWGHSNGGQIALSVLEGTGKPLPTTLWAPVTAPFPYSILFFSDEVDDEGKDLRKWLASFEKTYDVFEFSLTKHLDRLTGPIQLHHGSADEAALQVWSDEFTDKIETENDRRQQWQQDTTAAATTGSSSAEIEAAFGPEPLPLIELTYHKYPGADHNLQPSWNTVVARDLEFFDQHLR